ncbi:GNAT family N-acetyltransferase, partial [Singulisphaera rosea]
METARLRLQPAEPGHLLALIENSHVFEERSGLIAAEGLRQFFGSDDVSPEWVERVRGSSAADPWTYGFFVIHREIGKVIGAAGFKGPPNESGMVEIAYGIVPVHQGQGYATEVAEALLRFAFGSGPV